MISKNIYLHNILVLLLLILTSFLLIGAMKVYETGTLKSDGSGSIKIIYSGNASLLVQNKYIIGNFPFNENMAKEYFTSSNSDVKKAKLDFDIKDSIYFITVEIDFKDINKLSEAKGFSNVKGSYVKTDSGMVFNYIIVANPEFYKNFEEQSYSITFENKVKSYNGELKDNTVIWSKKDIKESDFSKDIVLKATTEIGKDNVLSNNVVAEDKKGKKCGVFGIELPFVILLGILLPLGMRYKKSL